ncbi:MAG: diguanylate cyclase, partial [Candidatus Omnitrophica bacterium]|nr:diguanylate cyclase [Candidatus Omnitrophota bacterium]
REVFLQAYELKKANEALQSCLATSAQTQVYNARFLNSRLSEECNRAKRYRRSLSCLLAAIDSMPELAEFQDSVFSEAIVQEVMRFLKENIRSVDVVIRYTDNRLVAILPETEFNQARIVVNRIRFAVEKSTFRVKEKELKLTVSVGLISFNPAVHRGKEDVLEGLEKALLEARQNGSNQIVGSANETPPAV